MLVTQEQKNQAIEILDGMRESIEQPDTDDLEFIRKDLKKQFDEMMKALGK